MPVGLEYVRLNFGVLGESTEGEVEEWILVAPRSGDWANPLQGTKVTSHGDHSQIGGRKQFFPSGSTKASRARIVDQFCMKQLAFRYSRIVL